MKRGAVGLLISLLVISVALILGLVALFADEDDTLSTSQAVGTLPSVTAVLGVAQVEVISQRVIWRTNPSAPWQLASDAQFAVEGNELSTLSDGEAQLIFYGGAVEMHIRNGSTLGFQQLRGDAASRARIQLETRIGDFVVTVNDVGAFVLVNDEWTLTTQNATFALNIRMDTTLDVLAGQVAVQASVGNQTVRSGERISITAGGELSAPAPIPTETPTPTATATPSATTTPSLTHTPTATPSVTSSPTPSMTVTHTATNTATHTSTLTATPTSTETPSPTNTPSSTPTSLPTTAESSSALPSATASLTPSTTPTQTTPPTATPSVTPSVTPTAIACEGTVINQTGLRVRATPSTEGERLGRIAWGLAVTITGFSTDGEWAAVSTEFGDGWMARSFLQLNPDCVLLELP